MLAIILLFPSVLYAQDSAKIVTLNETEVHQGDYFAYGDEVNILGKVDGDVYAFAEKVNIEGEVTGDLIVAGQDVKVSGHIGQDARLAGVNLDVSGKIDRNMSAASFNFNFTKDAFVGRNAQIAIDKGALEGTVVGETQKYTSEDMPKVDQQKVDEFSRGVDFASKLTSILSTFVFGYILIRLFPEYTQRATDNVLKRFRKSFLIGLAGLIAFPIVILLLLVTIVGLPMAFLLGCFFIVYLFLTRVYVILAMGDKFTSSANLILESREMRLGLGVLVYYALSFIPVIGGFVKLIVLIAGFGAAISNERSMYQMARKEKIF